MSLSKFRGNENIADVIGIEPDADINQIRQTLINVIRWLGDREPVSPGDVFLKFATWGGLVDRKVLSEKDILTNPDNPGDGDPPNEPEELYVEFMAREMSPSFSNGCSAFQVTETDPSNPNLHFVEFDPGVDTSCEFATVLPAGWIGGTFQFRLYWSHGFGSVADWDVTWELQVNTYSSGQTLARVLVPGSIVQTTGGVTDTLYITAESDPVNIPGSLNLPGNYVMVRIWRRGTSSADTLTVGARLHGIRFNLGNAPVDYPPPPSSAALLLHFDGNFTDFTSYAHTMTTGGGATTSATRWKWGTHAWTFNGTGYIHTPDAPEWAFAARDWSIDCWIYVPSSVTLATDNTLACVWGTGGLSLWVGLRSNGRLGYYDSLDGTTGRYWDASPVGGIPRDQWVHITWWRSGTVLNGAVDGVLFNALSGFTQSLYDPSVRLTIGASADGLAPMPADITIDEFRICVDVIDYANADFTPPAGPY